MTELSPLQSTTNDKTVTKEQFEEIKRILGVECLLIAIDERKHDCDAATCMGHWLYIRSDGFSPDQLTGMGKLLFEKGDVVAVSHKENE